MENKFRYIISLLILSFALAVPAMAQTAGEETLKQNKTATYDYETHIGEITLESYVPGEMKVVQKAKALDVVLLLDNSGSMTYGNRYKKLVTAVKSFLKLMSDNAEKNKVDHKVSIIVFGGKNFPSNTYTNPEKSDYLKEVDFNEKISGHTGTADNDYVTYNTSVIKRFCSIKDNLTTLDDIMDKFRPNGGNTMTTNGLDLTTMMFDSFGRTGDDVVRVVILFSDGQPSMDGAAGWYDTVGSYGALDHKGGFRVAVPSLEKTNALKSSGITIYSVYCNNNKPDANTQNFMEGCSSKYPSAKFDIKYNDSQPTTSGGKWIMGTKTDDKYYTDAEDSEEKLKKAFENIAEDIQVEVDEKYDLNTTMKDFVNNNYFQYPENANEGDIKVYQQNCTGFSQGTGGAPDVYSFESEMVDITGDVNVVLTRAKSETDRDLVEVYGFNYSANWCGIDITTDQPHGARLVVKFPFIFKGGQEVSGALQTNTEESGIYPVQKDPETGEPKIDPTGKPIPEENTETKFDPPVIYFNTLTITRKNLEPGETAIYEVTRDGSFICRIALGGEAGKETSGVSKTIYGLPGDEGVKFKVSETNWNWAYHEDGSTLPSAEKTVEISAGQPIPLMYEFSGAHLNMTDDHPAERHNHGESFKVNKMKVSTSTSTE